MAKIEIPQLNIPVEKSKPREILYQTGGVADRLFIVREGIVRTDWFREDGIGGISDLLVAPTIIGTEVLLAGRERYDATATAFSKCKIQTIYKEDLGGILREYPWLMEAVFTLEHDQKLRFLSRMNASRISKIVSIARVLLDLSQEMGNPIRGVSQELIGDMALATRAFVNRRLAKLPLSRVIDSEETGYRKDIKISDTEALRFIAEAGEVPTLRITNGR